jgi:NAD(P)H-nitrite reductase large subunit
VYNGYFLFEVSRVLVIIGAGMAGLGLIREIRALDQSISITLIDSQEQKVYSKPMLSTAFRQQKSPDDLIQESVETFCEKNKVKFLQHEVSHVDPQEKKVCFKNAPFLYFTKLVLATGARPVEPFSCDSRVIPYNSLSDLNCLYKQLDNAEHLCVLGSGIVGCELLNDLLFSSLNKKITLVSRSSRLMQERLPEETSSLLLKNLLHENLSYFFNHSRVDITSSKDRLTLSFQDGKELETDLVVVAYGLRVDTSICPAKHDRGFLVDPYMRTSLDSVYALGDCTQLAHGYIPYVQPLLAQGRALAKTLTGQLSQVCLPVMPIMVKTSRYPLCLFGPYGQDSYWERKEEGVWEAYHAKDKSLIGACLAGPAIMQKRFEYQNVLQGVWNSWLELS